MLKSLVICIVLVFLAASGARSRVHRNNRALVQESQCEELKDFKELRNIVRSYQPDVDRIIRFVQGQDERGKTWNELALFCDTFGPRMSGSKSLEAAIEYMSKKMRNESKLNVTAEPAMVPKWEVYKQWAEMSAPREHKMSILALGSSEPTPNGTIERDIVLVHDFKELDELGEQVRDKIVLYNYKFKSYSASVVYRVQGAERAAKYGAAAALVRSVTPFSIYSPHTGMASRSIATAAITIEDADLIERLIKRGHTVRVKLHIETKHFDKVKSYNLVGDLTGSSRPNEVVLVSGHLDSWYNTDGAMDDGGGMMVSYRALDVLSRLNLRGKRTVRAVLWTAEEFGLVGAQQYFNDHKHELENFQAVFESDEGTFRPLGLGQANLGQLGKCLLQEVLKLTRAIGADRLSDQYEGSDIELFTDAGVPGLSLLNKNKNYFYFHHTSGDSMTVEDPDDLDKSTILFAASAYVLSNLIDVDLRN